MHNPETIAVIDDDPIVQALLRHVLEEEGWRVDGYEAPGPALESAGRERWDLLLLDIRLPEMDGFEVLRRLREERSALVLPIIMMTGSHDSADVVEALRLGANDYVTKPPDIPVLLARVRKELALVRSERAVRRSEERFAVAVAATSDAIWDWSVQDGTVFYSPRWAEMLGIPAADFGSDIEAWLTRVHPTDLPALRDALDAHLGGRVPHFTSEHRLRHLDGSYRWVACRGSALRDGSGRATRIAGSVSDITEGKLTDPLTGLPSLLLFREQVHSLLEGRGALRPFAVIALSVDQRSEICNSLGVEAGDALVKEVAARLSEGLRRGDLACRGGDGFYAALRGIEGRTDVIAASAVLRSSLAQPYPWRDEWLHTTCSYGAAFSADGYENAAALLADADLAQMRAAASGGGQLVFFESRLREDAKDRIRIVSGMRHALERGEFDVHYQAIVSASDHRLAGFEALARWPASAGPAVSPAVFVPLAEDAGLIVDLGLHVLHQACRQAAEWNRGRTCGPRLTVSVNLSPRQFLGTDLVDQIVTALEQSRLEPACLKLELTESAMMAEPEAVLAVLRQLRGLGLGIAIDDFGTGYSSLAHLHRFPADVLKVDRSFVVRLGSSEDSLRIVRSVVQLAHGLGMRVVAEGVETGEQLHALASLECDYVQGYLLSRPLPAEGASRLVQADLEKGSPAAKPAAASPG